MPAIAEAARPKPIKVAGVKFPAYVRPGSKPLPLLGAGLRTKWLFKLYALAVYQVTRKYTAHHVIRANEQKFIWLHMLRPVKAADLAEAVNEGLRDNMPPKIRRQIAPQVALFVKALPPTIPKGAAIGFWYRPGKGVLVNIQHGAKLDLEGYDVMVAIWSIWFGKKPSDSGLKRDVLTRR